jgi:hypothetical protein
MARRPTTLAIFMLSTIRNSSSVVAIAHAKDLQRALGLQLYDALNIGSCSH